MSLYETTIPQMAKMLRNLDKWLDAAVAFAETKKFDPNTLLTARLAPDQYSLARQVQAACDTAKFAAGRLSGKEAPAHPDTEQTIAELKERVGKCLAYLETFKASDFNGAETRRIGLSFIPGKGLVGADYAKELGVPNFYFHATAAYMILRHNGVPLGKGDFLGSLTLVDV